MQIEVELDQTPTPGAWSNDAVAKALVLRSKLKAVEGGTRDPRDSKKQETFLYKVVDVSFQRPRATVIDISLGYLYSAKKRRE